MRPTWSNAHPGGRFFSAHAIPQLDLELALLDGWVRCWYERELLPLPADLQRDLDDARRQLEQERHRAEQERQGRLVAERELARLRAQSAELQARPAPEK